MEINVKRYKKINVAFCGCCNVTPRSIRYSKPRICMEQKRKTLAIKLMKCNAWTCVKTPWSNAEHFFHNDIDFNSTQNE